MQASKLSNEELDRIIHEKIMGGEWHKELRSTTHSDTNDYECLCGRKGVPCFFVNPSYCTSWEDYGRLLEKISKHKGFSKFVAPSYMVSILIKPRRGCEAICEFFCKEKT